MPLVADEFCSVPTEDMKLFMKAMRKYYMVQPQTYNTKDFSLDKNPFVAEILETGIEIQVIAAGCKYFNQCIAILYFYICDRINIFAR